MEVIGFLDTGIVEVDAYLRLGNTAVDAGDEKLRRREEARYGLMCMMLA